MTKESICTCRKLVVGDTEGLNLQFECVEGESWYHSQNLLCVAHVGVAERTLQVVETGVTGREGLCGERWISDSGTM